MTLTEFQSLEWDEWMAILEEHGVKIGKREDNYARMELYQVYAFYVEVAYTKHDGNLWKMGPFDHPKLLGPYLDQINLKDLLP